MRRLGRIAGLDDVGVIDQVEIGGHPRISQCYERLSDCRPLPALGGKLPVSPTGSKGRGLAAAVAPLLLGGRMATAPVLWSGRTLGVMAQ